ncbi:PAS domain S-box protein [Thermithiobacillus tepidarius DSM 3134]|uniref:sensor histidine kinase n=1 Tax=Thermithiobacillus tepidarius TaxID=929 RepID=UPI00041F312E|nr:PAS domain S-box protein [Thermithiobacillus tepidarius]
MSAADTPAANASALPTVVFLGAAPQHLALLDRVLGNGVRLSAAADWHALPHAAAAVVDAAVIEVADAAVNLALLLQAARERLPQAQLVFLGASRVLAQIRQKLILMGVLSEQWSFLKLEQPEQWPALLREAHSRAAKRRSLKLASPYGMARPAARPTITAAPRRELDSQYLASILQYAREAILFLDLDGCITFWNRAAAQLYGIARENVLGTPVEQLIAPSWREEHARMRQRILGGGEDVLCELEHLKADGTVLPVEQSLAAVRDWRGLVMGVAVIVRDISERLERERLQRERLEQAIAQVRMQALNEELERRVLERTAELTAANRELEAFSYSVSHDLRAPLRAIDGFSQALLEDYGEALDMAGREHLARVRRASQRMAELIDDLLNLSRITHSEMHRRSVNLSELAGQAAEHLRATQPQRPVTVVIVPDVIAHGDARLLQIALENLLGNAWKFTRKQADARIEFGMREQDGQPVYFVRDNGAGFDMAYADKLFGAFQRLHSPGEFEGHGIGLATVARIIARHGGRIWAEGAVGRGATFYFTLGGTGS